jgi:cytochrome d ubiquinol oxidase subunit I
MIPVTYWTFRFMVGAGVLAIVLAGVGLILMARRQLEQARWFHRVAVGAFVLPHVANISGWVFTEVGRQPWAVWGVLRIVDSGSPSVAAPVVATSLVGYTVVYGVLAAAATYLAVKLVRAGAAEDTTAASLVMTY